MIASSLISYDKIQEYSQGDGFFGVSWIWLITFVAVGLCFFILGWIISALTRVKNKEVLSESYNIKRSLLSELNTAKKFNSDYQVRARKKHQQEGKHKALAPKK